MLQLGTLNYLGKRLDELDKSLLNQLALLQDGESRTIRNNGVETYKVQRSHFMDRGFRRSFLMVEELTVEILESEKNEVVLFMQPMAGQRG